MPESKTLPAGGQDEEAPTQITLAATGSTGADLLALVGQREHRGVGPLMARLQAPGYRMAPIRTRKYLQASIPNTAQANNPVRSPPNP